MAELKLTLKEKPKVPVEAEVISPDVLAGKSVSEIASLNVWEGNSKIKIGDLFDIEGSTDGNPEATTIILEGDLTKVRRIGKKMTAGRIVVKASVGFYVGEEMTGGSIIVEGNAGSWAGSVMKGGSIEIKGNAGDYLTAGIRGICKGMMGGTITIHGDTGVELGYWMEKGTIRVGGNTGIFTGIHMKGGAIMIEGDAADRMGAGMTGGKIILMGRTNILPSFFIDGIKKKAKVKGEKIEGPFYVFTGDVTESGKGKLFILKEKNSHLSKFEKYIP